MNVFILFTNFLILSISKFERRTRRLKTKNKIKTEKSFDFEYKLGKQATRVLFRYVMFCFVLFLFCFDIGLIKKEGT